MSGPPPLSPAAFSRLSLEALARAEGRRKRRKRDQTPDGIGLEIKRALLLRAAQEQPPPEGFESWLLAQCMAAPASGPVRALAAEILAEYRVALLDPDYGRWLLAGGPSADVHDTHDPLA
jgi:hypothetical protein